MEHEIDGYVLLSDLATKLKINKSRLLYYESLGLIQPVTTVGKKRMRIYNMEETVKRVRFIEDAKKEKKSLVDIQKLLS